MRHIGIDPDLVKSGVAEVFDGQYQRIVALPIDQLFELIKSHGGDQETQFILEDVEALKPTFPRAAVARTARDEKKVRDTVSQKVGMVKASARMIEQMLIAHNCNYRKRRPLKGGIKAAKKKADYFKRITGWQGRTNEDMRDAALLVYQYTQWKTSS